MGPTWGLFSLSSLFRCTSSLQPSDAMWRQRSGLTLTRVSVCWLTAPRDYPNQCWLIMKRFLLYAPENNSTKSAHKLNTSSDTTLLKSLPNLPEANGLISFTSNHSYHGYVVSVDCYLTEFTRISKKSRSKTLLKKRYAWELRLPDLQMSYGDFKGMTSLIARFIGPTWGPSGADRTQMGPMLAPWALLSRMSLGFKSKRHGPLLM